MIDLVILEDRNWDKESNEKLELYVGEHTIEEIKFIAEKLNHFKYCELVGDYDNRDYLECKGSFITVIDEKISYVLELINSEAMEQLT